MKRKLILCSLGSTDRDSGLNTESYGPGFKDKCCWVLGIYQFLLNGSKMDPQFHLSRSVYSSKGGRKKPNQFVTVQAALKGSVRG